MRIKSTIQSIQKILIYLFFIAIPRVATADSFKITDPNNSVTRSGISPIEPGGKISSISSIGAIVINSLLLICAAVAVAFIAYAGVRYITAGGDTGKAEKAKSQIIWAVVGLIVISFSWFALKATISIFDLSDYSNPDIPQVPL